MRHRNRRGIAIIISLMMMVLVIMFVTAMVITFPTTVESSRDTAEGRKALAAAQSGVDYAWCRLQERPSWKGDGTGNASVTTVNTPNLTVIEDCGDVWGFLTDSQGEKSQFRIRFNWHDGGGGGDALNDPTQMIPGQFVSFNNLDQPGPTPVRRGTPNSTAMITTTSPSPYSVAQYSCCVLVEGLAGTGLRATTPLAPLPGLNDGRVVRQTLEIDLGRPTLANLDSAVYGGKISASGPGQILDVESKAAALPRSRTLSDIALSGGALYQTSAGGSIVASNTGFTSVPNTGVAPTIRHEDITTQRKKYLSVKMTDIAQATASDPKLPAGTYVWRETGKLDYYPVDFTGTVPAGAPAATFNDSAQLAAHMGAGGTNPITLDGTTYTLQYNKNIFVQPQGAIKSLAIVPESNIAVNKADRPKNLFQGGAGSAPVMTGSGDITLKGSLIGKGSVTTTGNLTFQGASVFETDPGKNVAIYAAGNVSMEQIPPEVALNLNPGNASSHGNHHSMHHHGHHSYNHSGHNSTNLINLSAAMIPNRLGPLNGNDVMIAGLVYAGGNFTTNLGPGSMYVRGAVVAYGGNADAGDVAGTPGKGGEVIVNSKGAQFTFDPTYVVSSMSLTTPTRLSLTLQNRY
jgi:hypothetical protein